MKEEASKSSWFIEMLVWARVESSRAPNRTSTETTRKKAHDQARTENDAVQRSPFCDTLANQKRKKEKPGVACNFSAPPRGIDTDSAHVASLL
jgi:hypothetical protein